jgi:hypothetical protein
MQIPQKGSKNNTTMRLPGKEVEKTPAVQKNTNEFQGIAHKLKATI